MKPFKIIEGSNQALDVFEQKVADALEMGYTLAGELVAFPQGSEIRFYQSVILDFSDDEDEDEDEEDEEYEDDA